MKITDYLSELKASAMLGIMPQTLKVWAKQGKVKAYVNPMNKRRLYLEKDIRGLLESIKWGD